MQWKISLSFYFVIIMYVTFLLECPSGKFGRNCNASCPVNCANNICNKSTGVCDSCKKDYYSAFCDKGWHCFPY